MNENFSPRKITSEGTIVDCRGSQQTALGKAEYIKIFTFDYKPLGWEDVWRAFAEIFPGKWALEVYPPAKELVNGKNVYHLFVFPKEPEGMNIKRGL
jgi:hypothetical protein